jgi:hypothetical protein
VFLPACTDIRISIVFLALKAVGVTTLALFELHRFRVQEACFEGFEAVSPGLAPVVDIA